MQTHPNAVVLGEDIEARKLTLIDMVREVADAVTERAAAGKNYGIVLVPEGVISYIPELRTLISEMNQVRSGRHKSSYDALLHCDGIAWCVVYSLSCIQRCYLLALHCSNANSCWS